jgi:hypothetical protein
MGTYYSIYAETHIGEKWYNINPLIKKLLATDSSINSKSAVLKMDAAG